MLGGDSLASEFEGGSMIIQRLAPQDYHHYHSPVNGFITKRFTITGPFYSVNSDAIRSENGAIYNQRVVTFLNSTYINPTTSSTVKIAFVTIGATCVGSIVHSVSVGANLTKGDKIGNFAFGGSTVVILFPPNTIEFDDDLVLSSSMGVEMLVNKGMSVDTFL